MNFFLYSIYIILDMINRRNIHSPKKFNLFNSLLKFLEHIEFELLSIIRKYKKVERFKIRISY